MIERQIKIAFLGNEIAWGGGAKSLLLLIKSLSNQNLKKYLFVTHCASQEMKMEFEQYVSFVKIVNLPCLTSAQTQTINDNLQGVDEKQIYSSNIKEFAEELNQLGIDILHINNSVFSLIYKYIKELTKVKIVSHIREWIDWNGIHQRQSFIIETIQTYSDAIVCISNNEAEVFRKHPKLLVIPNPFDFNELDIINNNSDLVKTRLDLPKDCFLVGMIGRASENKGILDLLRAISYLKSNYKNFNGFKFIILGCSDPFRYNSIGYFLRKIRGKSKFLFKLYRFIRKENLRYDVKFLSNRKDILEIVNLFDVAVRPSYSGDPWGRDIIEYMALKKPIVATGNSEFFIKNGETGFLVPPRDYVLLAEKIYWLYKNKTERIEFGERANKIISARCDIGAYRFNILQIYYSLMV